MDLEGCKERLAEIEQGNPCRAFRAKTLSDAKLTRNMVLMALGCSMSEFPRKLEPGESYSQMKHIPAGGVAVLTIEREEG
jgi:hypothetical protein